jgi:hypothetical protein
VTSYTTAFDVTRSGFKSWSFSATGAALVALGVMQLWIRHRNLFPNKFKYPFKRFPEAFLSFAVLWTATSFGSTFGDYRRAIRAMRENRVDFVQGTVSGFVPMPATGHSMESFLVTGVEFKYSDFVITAGFNNTASHGGPIREGLPVKIWYLGNEILRLDVAEAPNQSKDPAP